MKTQSGRSEQSPEPARELVLTILQPSLRMQCRMPEPEMASELTNKSERILVEKTSSNLLIDWSEQALAQSNWSSTSIVTWMQDNLHSKSPSRSPSNKGSNNAN